MNALITDLIAVGTPLWIIVPLVTLLAVILFIRCAASAAATVIKATHPGDSADAVKMQENRLHHRQWKAQRRDSNRRARAVRRALTCSTLSTWLPGGLWHDACTVVLPHAVIPAAGHARAPLHCSRASNAPSGNGAPLNISCCTSCSVLVGSSPRSALSRCRSSLYAASASLWRPDKYSASMRFIHRPS